MERREQVGFWIAVAALVAVGLALAARPARCHWCPSSACLSSATCGPCSCWRERGEATGVCVDIVESAR